MEIPARGRRRAVRERRGTPAIAAEPLPGDRTERLLRTLLRLGVCVVPFLPLYVSTSLLFPYVSGRNFAFRILIELLLVPLGVLVWLTKFRSVSEKQEHAPSRPASPAKTRAIRGLIARAARWLSPTTAALLMFVSWMALADVLGANPYRSVWSTYERMAGLLGLVHLVLFFFVLKAAFESLADWARYFSLSIAASSLVALMALFQYGVGVVYGSAARPDGTMGNAGVLAGYLLLHVFVCVLILATERRVVPRMLLIASLCLDLVTIVVSGTRSAILALLLVCPVLVVLAVWRRRGRIRSLLTPRLQRGLVLVAVLAVASLLLLLRHLPLSGNFARPSVGTGPWPRLTVWITTLRAVRERVWTGWGQENFYIVWERHYLPAGGFFDRAHNVILEWLSAGGIPALALLLAIGACVVRNMWSMARHTSDEALALGGFVAAYCIFNMFWFDTFETYVLLIGVMAFADWRAAIAPASDVVEEKSKAPVRRPLAPWIAALVTAIVIVPAIYVLNLRPLFLARDVIGALNAWRGGRLEETSARFDRAFSYRGLRSQEAIEQMAALVPQIVAARAATEPAQARRFVDRAIRELTSLTASPAVEARHVQMLGTVYASASALEPSYRALALDRFSRALAISPNNEQIYVGLSNFYASGGDFEQALAMMRRATMLAPHDSELLMRLAPLALRTGRPADAELEMFRVHLAAEKNLGRRAAGYLQTGDFEIARIVLEEMRKRDPANQQILEQYRTVVESLKAGRGAVPR